MPPAGAATCGLGVADCTGAGAGGGERREIPFLVAGADATAGFGTSARTAAGTRVGTATGLGAGAGAGGGDGGGVTDAGTEVSPSNSPSSNAFIGSDMAWMAR